MYNTATLTQDQYDTGLRNYMIGVYNNMLFGLLVTGLTAFYISTNTALMAFMWKTAFAWVVIFLPLVMSLGFMFLFDKLSPATARIFFYTYAVAMGASLSLLFMIFKIGSIFQAFFITSALFGVMSLYGYTTKKDLTSLGSFLMMGVIGLLIAGVVNLFLQSAMMSFIISCVAVLVFTLLVAFNTQNIKDTYDVGPWRYNVTTGEEREKIGILGALSLYMNFINLFIHLLQLIGEKKE
jgi:FtsH-binding integral membrane protein